MTLLAHLLREYHESDQYNDEDEYDNQDSFQDAEPDERNEHVPPQVEDTRKVHKIKQTFSVDQGDTKLDTTVMIRVVAANEADARKIADQQLSKLAAYMKDIDLNGRDQDDYTDSGIDGIRERADKMWRRKAQR